MLLGICSGTAKNRRGEVGLLGAGEAGWIEHLFGIPNCVTPLE